MYQQNHPEHHLIKRHHYLNPKLEFPILSNNLMDIEKVLRKKTISFVKGLQSLHLAMFFNKVSMVEYLLMIRDISVESKVDRILYEHYYKESKWRSEFGNKITLLTFAVLHNRVELASKLLWLGADPTIKSADNRSLLMCAVDNHSLEIVRMLVSRLSKADINHRDNLGLTAVHCLFKHNTCQCHRSSSIADVKLGYRRLKLLEALVDGGADINMLVDKNPASLLINMAAYRHECLMIEYLLPRQEDFSITRPLYYATLPDSIKHPLSYLCRARKTESVMLIRDVSAKSINLELPGNSYEFTVKFIFENIKLRMKNDFPVHPEEISLINSVDQEYFSRYDDIFSLRSDIFQRKLELLKSDILEYDNKKITICEVMTESNLKELVKDQSFLEAFERFYQCVMNKHIDGYYEKVIVMMLKVRVDQALHQVPVDDC